MTGRTAIIIGASRGLGLALAGELAARGWQVTATARGDAPGLARVAAASDGRMTLATVETDKVASIQALDAALAGQTFDLIFVNAAVMGPAHMSVDQVTEVEIGNLMMINAIAPVRLAKRLLPQARPGGTVVLMTSILGSVTLNVNGGFDLYRASKAALNSLSRGFYASVVAPLGLTLINLHPGWVRTRMGGDNATLSVAESIAGIVELIESPPGPGHHHLDYQRNPLPW
jgi:NAD(P)-dependent dehydrogenase (short-subunit alcohol dehydrogenase family)